MEECEEIKNDDEMRSSRYRSLERHVEEFVEILQEIKEFADDQKKRKRLVRFGTAKKDMGLIQEYHGKLKAAVDRFNVQSHIANSGTLNRIETLLRNMTLTSQELESVDESSDTRTDGSANQGPQVVLPISESRDRTSTMESTSSNIPSQNVDVATPIPQPALSSQETRSISSEARSQVGDQAFEVQIIQETPSPAPDRESVSSTPSRTKPRDENPNPIPRAESSPASFRSTSTNPFLTRLAMIPDAGRSPLPTPPTSTYTPNLFSSPTSDTQNPFSSMFNPASSGPIVSGNVTVNNVSGGQNVTTNNPTNHNVNTGNTYNTSTVNSNNRYEHSSDPWFSSSGPTYNFHPNVWTPPQNHFQHGQRPSWPGHQRPHYPSWPTPPDHEYAHYPSRSTPPDHFHPPGPPYYSNHRGRGDLYYRDA
ncbi:hypothetical protein E1B28_008460 [Marasmius oreades]|nr:uncharacterized protein E1B28_008460 [Marasmius oreades]KAG7092082.1 hypothetical protein E1B28_008460 [Marasmius oreades]